jgi:peptidoglycan/xylan/chitin deacetylase (PgdA/CDA1 family)
LQAELRRTIPLFCYPNGNNNGRVREAVARAGYVCAVSTEHGLNDAGANIFALKRVHTEADLAHFAQNTSGFEDYKNRLRGSGNKAAPPPFDDY